MLTTSLPLHLAPKRIFIPVLFLFMAFGLIGQAEGKVGIGTTNPSEKLDVNGNIKLSGELMPGGAAGTSGQLLQSNGDGSMQWASPELSSGSGGVGYGTWGDCEMAGLSEYYPVSDPEGKVADEIGYSVAISGNYAVVGARGDEGGNGNAGGSVTVLVFDPNPGVWVRDGDNKIFGEGAEQDDYFGHSVAIDGDYMVVGAPYDNGPAGVSQGSISIYKRNPSSGIWELQGNKMMNPGAEANENFGWSVGISGDYVIAGTPFDDYIGGTDHGSAVVFKRNPATGIWSLDGATKIIDPDNASGDRFGWSVSISGEYAVIGSPFDDGPDGLNQGSFSVFKRNSVSGIWENYGGKVFMPNAQGRSDDEFGNSVCIDGDYVIAGAPYDDMVGISNAGSAYVFKRYEESGSVIWEPFGIMLSSPELSVNSYFGIDVKITGKYALVGSAQSNALKGDAVIFVNVGPAFQGMQRITDPWGNAYDHFGNAVDLEDSSNRFVIGAFGAFGTIGKVVFGKF